MFDIDYKLGRDVIIAIRIHLLLARALRQLTRRLRRDACARDETVFLSKLGT